MPWDVARPKRPRKHQSPRRARGCTTAPTPRSPPPSATTTTRRRASAGTTRRSSRRSSGRSWTATLSARTHAPRPSTPSSAGASAWTAPTWPTSSPSSARSATTARRSRARCPRASRAACPWTTEAPTAEDHRARRGGVPPAPGFGLPGMSVPRRPCRRGERPAATRTYVVRILELVWIWSWQHCGRGRERRPSSASPHRAEFPPGFTPSRISPTHVVKTTYEGGPEAPIRRRAVRPARGG
jgi:hypothetical protein